MHTPEGRITAELIEIVPLMITGLFEHTVRAALKGDLFEADSLSRKLLPLCDSPAWRAPALRSLIKGFRQELFDPAPALRHEWQLWRSFAGQAAGQVWPAEWVRKAVQEIPPGEWERRRREPEPESVAGLMVETLIRTAQRRLPEAIETGCKARDAAAGADHFPLWFDLQVRLLPALAQGLPPQHPARLAWETGPTGMTLVPWSREEVRRKMREHFPALCKEVLGDQA